MKSKLLNHFTLVVVGVLIGVGATLVLTDRTEVEALNSDPSTVSRALMASPSNFDDNAVGVLHQASVLNAELASAVARQTTNAELRDLAESIRKESDEALNRLQDYSAKRAITP